MRSAANRVPGCLPAAFQRPNGVYADALVMFRDL